MKKSKKLRRKIFPVKAIKSSQVSNIHTSLIVVLSKSIPFVYPKYKKDIAKFLIDNKDKYRLIYNYSNKNIIRIITESNVSILRSHRFIAPNVMKGEIYQIHFFYTNKNKIIADEEIGLQKRFRIIKFIK